MSSSEVLRFSTPVAELISERYSCRAYKKTPIRTEDARKLNAFIDTIQWGPLGAPLRFMLAAATEQDSAALRGLGTYGLIRDMSGFLIGTAGLGARNMEDFGYGMESVILYATDLGLDTCWVGGVFTRSTFARRIGVEKGETLPCVVTIGYASEESKLRRKPGTDRRLPWEALFFSHGFDAALTRQSAGEYAVPLEMLRLAPSSRNTQPWRVLKADRCFHFYLARSGGYGPGSIPMLLLGLADLQRVDLGIAMCHFELTAMEQGLMGRWVVHDSDLPLPQEGRLEYVVSWEMD